MWQAREWQRASARAWEQAWAWLRSGWRRWLERSWGSGLIVGQHEINGGEDGYGSDRDGGEEKIAAVHGLQLVYRHADGVFLGSLWLGCSGLGANQARGKGQGGFEFIERTHCAAGARVGVASEQAHDP